MATKVTFYVEPEKMPFRSFLHHKRKVWGGILVLVGFVLSPLSWWNDAVVNVPLAWLSASVVAYFWPPAFKWAFVISYWITNVAGLALMHLGVHGVSGRKPISKRQWLRSLAITLLYTLGMIFLIQSEVIVPFPKNMF